MPASASRDGKEDPKSPRSTQIIIALIGFAATALVGYWQFGRAKPEIPSAKGQITGRVVDTVSDHTLGHAKVMLESEGLPSVQYTDSEGVFTFPLPPSAPYVRLKVEMAGYESTDRRIDPSSLREAQEIRLQPLQASSPSPPVDPAPRGAEASRDFIIGRWQVEQANGQFSSGTVMDFQADGTFTGSQTLFVNGLGQRQDMAGSWNVEKLSKDTFRLEAQYQNGQTQMARFRVIDHNHIHNIDQNYISVRLE
jgi:hypothetical protein